jgi:hypothetical protein
MGGRRVFLSLLADSRQDYVTARTVFPAHCGDHVRKRNEYFTKNGNFSYRKAL